MNSTSAVTENSPDYMYHHKWSIRTAANTVSAPIQNTPAHVPGSKSFMPQKNAETGIEDWTTISDPKERRKVQNRNAQKSYRRKIRNKLRTLEKSKTDRSGGGIDTTDTSAVLPPPESLRTSAEPSFLPPAQQQHGSQQSEDTSYVSPSTLQDQILCPQCGLPLLWPGMIEAPKIGYSWTPLGSMGSGAFNEGYSAQNQISRF